MLSLGVWILLSAVWSLSAPRSMRESERMLIYVAVALAVAIVLRRGDGPGVLAGAVIGTTLICTYGLATRLFTDLVTTADDPLFEHRLAQPLGSPNGLGVLAAMVSSSRLGSWHTVGVRWLRFSPRSSSHPDRSPLLHFQPQRLGGTGCVLRCRRSARSALAAHALGDV